MIELTQRSKPYQIALPYGLAVTVRPLNTSGMAAAQAAARRAVEAIERSFSDMVAFNRRSAKTHSGIWRDLAVRRRRTEVDALIAPSVEIGRSRGLATPLCARLVELIHDLENGRRRQDWAALDELVAVHEAARGEGGAA